MIDLIRLIVSLSAFAAIVHFGRLTYLATLNRLHVERQNYKLLTGLGVRIDDIHARLARIEERVDDPSAKAAEQEG